MVNIDQNTRVLLPHNDADFVMNSLIHLKQIGPVVVIEAVSINHAREFGSKFHERAGCIAGMISIAAFVNCGFHIRRGLVFDAKTLTLPLLNVSPRQGVGVEVGGYDI
jgi:hypothetical protein